jgi:hypothetical protein
MLSSGNFRWITILVVCFGIIGCEKATRANLDKVHAGQTQSEVEALLGAGNYKKGETPDRDGVCSWEVWATAKLNIKVGYDKDGKVCFWGSSG